MGTMGNTLNSYITKICYSDSDVADDTNTKQNDVGLAPKEQQEPPPSEETDSNQNQNMKIFTMAELQAATRNFKPYSIIGEGGFGKVYKGWVNEETLAPSKPGSGIAVAVKVYTGSGSLDIKQWKAEVRVLGKFSHPNLVKLLGYCWEQERFVLVYEFVARGSLDQHLFSTKHVLSWRNRLKIALGAAKGLAFLHSSSEKSVIYRDFKPANILLDSDYNAKLTDFGLARFGPTNGQSHVSTSVLGTPGYAAPEYVASGRLYIKSDVYGFGIVLLEILTGLKLIDMTRRPKEYNLVEWKKPYLDSRRVLKEIMDPALEHNYSERAAKRVAMLTLGCLDTNPRFRPSMNIVVSTLLEAMVESEEI